MMTAILDTLNVLSHLRSNRALRAEVDDLRAENARLRARAEAAAPFAEVEKRFPADAVLRVIQSRVVEELTPVLSRDAIICVVEGFRAIERKRTSPAMTMRAAYHPEARVYELRFDVRAHGTSIQLHRDLVEDLQGGPFSPCPI